MRRVLYLSLFLFACAVPALAQDPVQVDPKHYKVEFENANVRVLRIKIGPGEKSIMHQHPDAVAVFQSSGRGKFTFPDGKTEERDIVAGQAIWTPATTHLPENIGSAEFEVILIELKHEAKANEQGTPTSKPGIAGGVLNGKAISKPEPVYPPVAKAARASGSVTVEILVDESGRVVSASAVSGHPLLQGAAVTAAREARFSPTLLSGQPVKVSGVLTYNFVLPK
ncbi:MAG TPA: TonB family protein [Pyrinomonadaceae bacterium]|nr:TonB family protein [Pyrinomonadaceae bacterium]